LGTTFGFFISHFKGVHAMAKPDPEATESKDSQSVFVVHGRNIEARDALFQFLRTIGLKPKEWSQAVSDTGKASPFIGEVLDRAFTVARAIVVLLTPDDEARLREQFRSPTDPSHEIELTPQARPNVLFEAGMGMGRDPDRTILVELGNTRPFSDIAGRHVIRLNNSTQRRQEFAQRLSRAGCAVDLSGTDWHTAGNFDLKSTASIVPSYKSVRVQKRKKVIGSYDVTFPQVSGLPNTSVQDRINAFLRRAFTADIDEEEDTQEVEASEPQSEPEGENEPFHFGERNISYITTLNSDGILSIKYEFYGTGGAHPIHDYKAFTIELASGYVYNFEDLFRPESRYIPVINNLIFKSLKQQNEPEYDIPTDFQERKEYDFYLSKKHLVLFNLFDYYAAQWVEAFIKPSEIAYIINRDGPLQALLKK
jgi:predicted nucleotide-binding protein